MTEKLHIEVCYALPEEQKLLRIEVAVGTSAAQAVADSGILKFFPEIDTNNLELGIYNVTVENEMLLKDGDRVEIYRPLLADPKEVRKRRAAEMKAKREAQKQEKAQKKA